MDAVWDTFHACGAERLQPAGSDGWGMADEAAEQGWWALDEEDEEERQEEEQQEEQVGVKPGGEREEGPGGGSEDEREDEVCWLGQRVIWELEQCRAIGCMLRLPAPEGINCCAFSSTRNQAVRFHATRPAAAAG